MNVRVVVTFNINVIMPYHRIPRVAQRTLPAMGRELSSCNFHLIIFHLKEILSKLPPSTVEFLSYVTIPFKSLKPVGVGFRHLASAIVPHMYYAFCKQIVLTAVGRLF